MEKTRIYKTPQTEVVSIATSHQVLDKIFNYSDSKTVSGEATNGSSVWDTDDNDNSPIWGNE